MNVLPGVVLGIFVIAIIYGIYKKWDKYDYLVVLTIITFIVSGIVIIWVFLYDLYSDRQERERFNQEIARVSREYDEKHKDLWDGYKGTRRNSIAEREKLLADGIDPEQYRRAHGY